LLVRVAVSVQLSVQVIALAKDDEPDVESPFLAQPGQDDYAFETPGRTPIAVNILIGSGKDRNTGRPN
jgi:hypothetical protein